MKTKYINATLLTIAVIVAISFAASKLQLRSPSLTDSELEHIVSSRNIPDVSERISRLETDLVIANAQYLATKISAMHDASKFFDTMSRKMKGGVSEDTYHHAKAKLDQSKLEFEQASDKARKLYLEMKTLDPNNKKMLGIRDAGRVIGGTSPYDD